MRLITLGNGQRDGELAVVHPDGERCVSAREIAPTLQAALDAWDEVAPGLYAMANDVAGGRREARPIPWDRVRAPLPRAYEWVDGSAYINHIVLVRKARGAEPPKTLLTDPLVYQGGSSEMLGARDAFELVDPAWGLDFESEVAVILADTPRGVAASDAGKYVQLVPLVNDFTYRNLIPPELEKGFGFFTSKPATGFAPFAVTPDELGDTFRDGRVHLRLETRLNGERVGDPEGGPEMHFSFNDLIAHITKTRRYTAGTILGSGTVSNQDRARGISCLAEQRMIEIIEGGKPVTPFLKVGDKVEIEMKDATGRSIFGCIQQAVVEPKGGKR